MIFIKLTVSHKANCCGDLSSRRVAATYRPVCPGLENHERFAIVRMRQVTVILIGRLL